MVITVFTLYIVTWNVGSQNPPPNLNLHPLLGLPDLRPDLYVIGLQEIGCILNKWRWKKAIKTVLKQYNCVRLKSNQLNGIVIFIFAKNSIMAMKDFKKARTATGIMNLWGNKGATTICMALFDISMCFINSHLNAHDEGTMRRLKDIKRVEILQKFKKKYASDMLIFWFGDMNFRLTNTLQMSPSDIIQELNDGNMDKIFEYDELHVLMQTKEVFHMFKEFRPITFRPTYKFQLGENCKFYDTTRRPAWTDRIVYKDSRNIVVPVSYHSVEDYKISDHKPVTAFFKVTSEKTVMSSSAHLALNPESVEEVGNTEVDQSKV